MEDRTFEGVVYEWSQEITKDNKNKRLGGITLSDIRKLDRKLKKNLGDKDKAIKELLDSMQEEYLKGAKAMLEHIRANVTYCNGKDGCSVCLEGDRFIKKLNNVNVALDDGGKNVS